MSHSRSRLGASLAAALLVLGIAACGDSDDGGNDAAAGASKPAPAVEAGTTGPEGGGDAARGSAEPTDERKAVRTAYIAIQAALYRGDAEAYCDSVTNTATADTDRALANDRDACEAMVVDNVPSPLPPAVVARNRARILGVKVHGDKATVRVKSTGNPPRDAPFVKEDGRWKLDWVWSAATQP